MPLACFVASFCLRCASAYNAQVVHLERHDVTIASRDEARRDVKSRRRVLRENPVACIEQEARVYKTRNRQFAWCIGAHPSVSLPLATTRTRSWRGFPVVHPTIMEMKHGAETHARKTTRNVESLSSHCESILLGLGLARCVIALYAYWLLDTTVDSSLRERGSCCSTYTVPTSC
jgi:hypothetical protein